jgi:hypothetical protein
MPGKIPDTYNVRKIVEALIQELVKEGCIEGRKRKTKTTSKHRTRLLTKIMRLLLINV